MVCGFLARSQALKPDALARVGRLVAVTLPSAGVIAVTDAESELPEKLVAAVGACWLTRYFKSRRAPAASHAEAHQ